MQHFLDFEKPIADLQARIAELRDTADSGAIDIDNGEWLTETEQLDTDQSTANGAQTLYATWGGRTGHIGWDGVNWGVGGTMWAYYDVHDGVGSSSRLL